MAAGGGLWTHFILVMFGAVPLAMGVVLLALSRRRGAGHAACGQCGYDVSASIESGSRCPECGSAFVEVGITPPAGGGRRNPVLVAIGLMLIVVAVGFLLVSALAIRHAVMEP